MISTFKTKQSVTINKPVEEVFNFLATDWFENRSNWATQEMQLVRVSSGPTGVGTSAVSRGPDARGREVESIVTITEYELNRKFAIHRIDAFAASASEAASTRPIASQTYVDRRGSLAFEPVARGTRLTVTNEVKYEQLSTYGWMFMIFASVPYHSRFRKAARRQLDKALYALEGPSLRRKISGFLYCAWSWWFVHAAVLLLLAWVYSAHSELHLAALPLQLLQTALTLMGIIGVLALYLYGRRKPGQ